MIDGIIVVILVRTTISIPDEIFESAEREARRLGLSRGEFYAAALKSYLKRRQNERVTERLNELYGKTSSRIDFSLRAMQARSL